MPMTNFPTLQDIFSSYSSAVAIQEQNFSLTYSDLQKVLHQLIRHPLLQQISARSTLTKNSRVALILRPRWEFLPLLLWAYIEKQTLLLLSPLLPLESLEETLQQFSIDAEALIGENEVNQLFTSLDNTQAGPDYHHHWNLDWNLEQEAILVLTSGSTGKPKAVLHTWGSLLYSAWGTIQFYSVSPHDRWLLNLPVNHVGGLLIFLRTLLAGGTTLIGNPQETLPQNLQFLSLVPTQLIRMLKNVSLLKILQSAKAILLGGGPISPWIYQEAERLSLPLSATYGLTEAGAQVTASNSNTSTHLGEPLPYREVKINSQNEILIRGKTLFKAYILKNNVREYPFDEQGYFSSHDLGEFDSDGHLHLWGRSDSIFISGGENIHPFTIENNLRNFPGILEAMVVPKEHPEFGKIPLAFIEWTGQGPFPEEEIKTFLKKSLPPYMIPKYFLSFPLPQALQLQGAIKRKRKDLIAYAAKAF